MLVSGTGQIRGDIFFSASPKDSFDGQGTLGWVGRWALSEWFASNFLGHNQMHSGLRLLAIFFLAKYVDDGRTEYVVFRVGQDRQTHITTHQHLSI